jgi:hypothetical protein
VSSTLGEGKMANVIQVVPEGKKKWKVLVDYIQHGAFYGNSSVANHEAVVFHTKHAPTAKLFLAEETVKV